MKRLIKKCIVAMLLCSCVFGVTACSQESSGKSVNTKEVANDYYIDLTELGMKLTIYLRLDENGNFKFSNTLDFEVNKSDGTFQKSGDEYVMVYTSVNGEEKSISEGLTSSFVVTEDGSLDFTTCEKIYYGSASATSRSDENPDAKLIAHVVTEAFAAPSMETKFQTGTYVTEDVTIDGVVYANHISFYEDKTYLQVTSYDKEGMQHYTYETGTYGVNATQIALEPENGERLECEVLDETNLKVSVFPYKGETERQALHFTKIEQAEQAERFSGDANVVLYSDGSCEITAGGFAETGILLLDSETGFMKFYPDHPETKIRGLSQVATVPSGNCTYENGTMMLSGLRVRNSESLTRNEVTVTR